VILTLIICTVMVAIAITVALMVRSLTK